MAAHLQLWCLDECRYIGLAHTCNTMYIVMMLSCDARKYKHVHRKKESIFCQLQTHCAAAEQEHSSCSRTSNSSSTGRVEQSKRTVSLLPSCCSYLSAMTLSCAVLKMLLSVGVKASAPQI